MEYIAQFFEWLKVAFAKSTLFLIFGTLAAVVMSLITDKIIKPSIITTEEHENLGISILEYWVFLFFTFMIIVVGIRIVELTIKAVLIKKEPKPE